VFIKLKTFLSPAMNLKKNGITSEKFCQTQTYTQCNQHAAVIFSGITMIFVTVEWEEGWGANCDGYNLPFVFTFFYLIPICNVFNSLLGCS